MAEKVKKVIGFGNSVGVSFDFAPVIMAEKTKRVIKFGNSVGISFDNAIQFATGIKKDDEVLVKCSPNKIIITKIKGD